MSWRRADLSLWNGLRWLQNRFMRDQNCAAVRHQACTLEARASNLVRSYQQVLRDSPLMLFGYPIRRRTTWAATAWLNYRYTTDVSELVSRVFHRKKSTKEITCVIFLDAFAKLSASSRMYVRQHGRTRRPPPREDFDEIWYLSFRQSVKNACFIEVVQE
jgi:hypothetical protein